MAWFDPQSRRVAAGLMGLAATGCFAALRDRACDTADPDCFPDEVCQQGRCETAPDAAAEADAGKRTLSVHVRDRGRGTELPAATVDFDDNGGEQCSCLASASAGPCLLEVPASGAVAVCARAHGYRACVRPNVSTAAAEIDLELDACEAAETCDDTPGACGCAGLPTCRGTEDP